VNYRLITSPEDLPIAAEAIAKASVVGHDIETTSLDPQDGEIRLAQYIVPSEDNDGAGTIFVIDLFQTKGFGPVLQAMRDSKAIWVIHNAKFEQKWYWYHHRFRLWPIFCTFRASALLYNGKVALHHDLYSVMARELSVYPKSRDQSETNWSGHLTEEQIRYSAEDVLHLLRLRIALREKLDRDYLLRVALIEFDVVLAEGRVELNGFPIDKGLWLALAEANVIERVRLREELLNELPHPKGQLGLPGMAPGWNIDSPQQMKEVLQRLGVKFKDDEGTAEIVLAQKASRCKYIPKILKYRHIAQFVKTFGEPYLRHVRESTGRIHADYYPMLVTGRYAPSGPNLSQIPRDADFRRCFATVPGRIFVLADYSGIEMRICAEISGDPALTGVFVRGEDAHRATAAIITGKRPEDVSKGERQEAKPVNFGFIYGMMPDKLVLYAQANYGVVLSLGQARKYRERYFERYSGVASWHKRVLRDGQRTGISRTLSGRLRYLDPHDAYNEFYNTPVQGTGADALKASLAIVQRKIDAEFGISAPKQADGPVCLDHHVHDEIIAECNDHPEMVEHTKTIVHDGMYEGMAQFLKNVPTVVDPSAGRSWAAAK
jgi:DNA polymerase I-like protein with 3'-5' exonuclease and polymerase domains